MLTNTEDSLAQMLREVAAAPAMPLPGRPVAKDLATGTEVDGRFTIVEKIGAGGMGVVYRADDTQLSRSVALKIVPLYEREVERAMREARTMAQLSHPNVVTVHDVGLLDADHLYIAMEFVQGVTARKWLAAQPRSPAEILRLYTDAGQGLVAAHAAGLIHRDFKPDNVLVGDDGRVRIADFGLARVRTGEADEVLSAEALHETDRHGVDPRTTLPSRSAIAGTPTYMSPEQRKGRSTDARTDQFSFCVSLWEALYGRPPFPLGELDVSMTPEVPRQRGRSRWFESALRRGLEFFPDDRFASMGELLDTLERPARRARRLRFTLAGTVAAGAMVASGFVVADVRRASNCEAGSSGAHDVWSGERKQSFHDKLAAMDPVHGIDAAGNFVSNVTLWANSWSQHYEEACLEASSMDNQTAGLRGARLRCLEGQLTAVDTVLSQIEQFESSPSSLARIEAYAYTLPNARDCSRPGVLAGQVVSGDEMGADLVAITKDIRRLEAYEMVGDGVRGLALAEELLARTERGRFPAARSEVFLRLGLLQSHAGDWKTAEQTLTESFFEARAAASDHAAAGVAVQLMWVNIHQGQFAEAKRWGRHARAAVAQRDVSAELSGQLECTLGVLAEYLGDIDAALEHSERCLPLLEEGFGPKHPQVANALNDRGSALQAAGRLEEARRAYDRALSLRRRAIKTPDAMTSIILGNRALAAQAQGDLEAAVRDQREALAIMTNLVETDSPLLVIPLLNLATALNEAEKFDESIARLQRAKALGIEHLGPDHPDMVNVHAALGEAYLRSNRREPARVELESALKIANEAEAPNQALVAGIREYLAAIETGESIFPPAKPDQAGED